MSSTRLGCGVIWFKIWARAQRSLYGRFGHCDRPVLGELPPKRSVVADCPLLIDAAVSPQPPARATRAPKRPFVIQAWGGTKTLGRVSRSAPRTPSVFCGQ